MGFPALVADPYLNGRLTALHASSDLWACGASLRHGQALVTLPRCSESVQQELLAQTLAGVQSVLPLIGGHTLQALEVQRSQQAFGQTAQPGFGGERPAARRPVELGEGTAQAW